MQQIQGERPRMGTATRDFFTLTFVLAALAASFRIGLALEYSTARPIAFLAFLLAFASARLDRDRRRVTIAAVVGAVTLGVTGFANGIEAGAMLAIGGTATLVLVAGDFRKRFAGLLPGIAVWAGILVGMRASDSLWSIRQSISASYSELASLFLNQTPRWAASASGVDLALLGIAILGAQFAYDRRWTIRRSLAVIAIGAAPVFIVVQGVSSFELLTPRNGSLDAAQVFLYQLLMLPILAASLLLAASRTERGDWNIRWSSIRIAPRVAAASLLAVTAAVVSVGYRHGNESDAPREGSRIVVSSRLPGLNDFSSPVWGRYGFGATGLYGEFRRALEATGRDVHIDDGSLTDADLNSADTLVIIAPDKSYDADEVDRIHAFVENGGGLLVMTDHTDLLGTMDASNRILAPYGIDVRFDTAMEVSRAFEGNLEFRANGIFEGDPEPIATQILHGASLRCTSPGRPWIVGRAMFGDFGNRSNGGQEAFLGDYGMTAAAEQVGDLVLAATARSGKGRVVVFGDTSSFQNVAMSRSTGFVFDIFAWLEGRDRNALGVFSYIYLILGLGMLAIFSWRPSWHSLVFAPLAVGVITIASAIAIEPFNNATAADVVKGDAKVFVLHTTPMDRGDRDHFRDHSIQGLMTCASRALRIPLAGDVGTIKDLDRCSEIIVPANADIADDLVQRLIRYVDSGGTLVVASGHEERHGVEPLVAAFGYQITSVPQGAAPILQFEEMSRYKGPRFAEAWGIRELTSNAVETEVLFAVDEIPIAVRRSYGRGTFVLIADSWFLTDKFLEGEKESTPPNIEFVRQLLFHETSTAKNGEAR